MQIPNFIKQIPTQIDHACIVFIKKGTEAKLWIDLFAKAKFDEFTQTDFCKQHLTPLFERNLAPLKKDDYRLIQRCFTGALLLNALAIKIFGIGALPLAAGAGTLMMMGVSYFMREKVNQHFNKIAWDEIDKIRKTAHTITRENLKFAEISTNRSKLNGKEFERLESDFKQLDEQIRIFREVVQSPHEIDIADSKQALVNYLTGLQQKLVADKIVEPLT